MIRKTSIVAIGVLIGGSFYLLLIDTVSLPEVYVLAGVALACGLLFEFSREHGFEEARIAPRMLAGVWRLAVKIPVDIGLLIREAIAQLAHPQASRGAFRAVRFGATERTPEATGRRALTEALGSVSPNTLVLGVDCERGRLIVHQLRRQGSAEDLDVLRLG